MWIEETKNGKFKAVERYEDYLTGKTKRVSVTMEKNTAQSRKLAQAALNDKINAALTKSPAPQKEYDFQELAKAFLEEKKKELKSSSIHVYTGKLEILSVMLGRDSLITKFTAHYVRTNIIHGVNEKRTANSYIALFKSLIKWAYQHDLVSDISYLDKITVLKVDSSKKHIEEKFLESCDISPLLAGMKVDIWKNMTKFLLLSGLRYGEASALTAADLDLKNRLIHVNKTYNTREYIVTTPKTPESARDVYMQNELYLLCRELKVSALTNKLACGCDLVFQKDGKCVRYCSFFSYLEYTSNKILGRKITPHMLRHTHASLLMEQGIPIEEISKRLGHEDSSITKDIYLHVTEKLQEQRNERLKKIKLL